MSSTPSSSSGSLSTPVVDRERFSTDACIWPREHEELWAAKHSFLTKFTGWLLILTQVGTIVGNIFGLDGRVDVLAFVAGASVLKGRQSWLRLYLFLYVVVSLDALLSVFQVAVLDQPFETDGYGADRWITRTDTEFWTEFIPFIGVSILLAASSVLCLRTRQLAFWTTTSKIWGGIGAGFIALFLIVGLFSALNERRNSKELTQEFAEEIKIVRHELDTSSFPSSALRKEPILLSSKRIKMIVWDKLNHGVSVIFYRGDGYSYSKNGDFQIPHQLPSGEHGTIHFYFEKSEAANSQ